jgi:23S rRNA (adenine-N6)-dimethyltransferase
VSAGRTRWGWHLLANDWAATLVAEAGISPGDLVLDVGAGRGALTAPLLGRTARVVAIELHPQRAAQLRARFGDRVTVVVADAADLRLPTRPFRVVANPPFAVTTALLKRLVAPGSRLVRADVVVPAHVARRWAGGGAPGWGRWQRTFSARVARSIPRSAFSPPAPHGVALLVLERRRGVGWGGNSGGR